MDFKVELLTMGEHFGLALIGLLLFSLFAVRKNLKKFNVKIFFNDNKPFWLWSIAIQFILAGLMTFKPDMAEAIKSLIGIDFSEPMAFFTSGMALSSAANWAIGVKNEKNKIGTGTGG